MQYRKGIAPFVTTLFMLSACAPLPPRSGPAYPPPPARDDVRSARAYDLEYLVLYGESMRRLPPAQLESEYAAAREEHRRAPNSVTRLKLALLASSRGAPFRDDSWARQLLHATAQDPHADEAVRAAAALWLHELEQRLVLERALEDERRQRQTLERKLEQLKTIEEEIDRRPPTPGVPR